MRTPTSILVLLALFAPAVAADVLAVPGAYPSVQAAVAASSPGDTVLVAAGDYPELVTVDRALALVADDGPVRLGRLIVRDLPAGETVLVRGVGASTMFGPGWPDPGEALNVLDCAGPVRFEDAIFRGSGGYGVVFVPDPHPDGFVGARVQDCASVVFTRCSLVGGAGQTIDDEDFDYRGYGADGLYVDGADVSVHGGMCTGGEGGSIFDTLSIDGGSGGDGIEALNATLFVEGSVLTGGDGGDADCDIFACGSGGYGGNGAWLGHYLGHPTDAIFRDVTFAPGAGGRDGDFQGWAPDGQDVLRYPASTETHLAAPSREFETNSPVREGLLALQGFSGLETYDELFVWVSVGTRWSYLPIRDGVFLVDNGAGAANALLYLGVQPIGGSFDTGFTVPELGPGVQDLTLFWQGIVRDSGGEWHLGPVSAQTYLDGAF